MKTLIGMVAAVAVMASVGARADELDDLLAEDDDGSAEESSDESSDEETSDDSDGEDAGEAEEEEGEDAALMAARKPTATRLFFDLPCCERVEGVAEVLIPGKSAWKAVQDGYHYPLGSTYRTSGANSRLTVAFGSEAKVSIGGSASFSTRAQKINENVRSVGLVAGTLSVTLPNDMPTNSFSVTAPGFTVLNPVGQSRYTYRRGVDGDEALVRCVTKTMTVVGPHFTIPAMRAANEFRIRTSQDQLMTALYGTRGDIMVKLDQGEVQVKDVGTGEFVVDQKTLDWKLSPLTAVRIHRVKPSVGSRLAVAVMTFNANGELKNRRVFVEKTPSINSGELGPTSKKEREELEKRAAALDAEGAEVDVEATDTDESGDSSDSEDSGDLDF